VVSKRGYCAHQGVNKLGRFIRQLKNKKMDNESNVAPEVTTEEVVEEVVETEAAAPEATEEGAEVVEETAEVSEEEFAG
jgi:hypothetical protein